MAPVDEPATRSGSLAGTTAEEGSVTADDSVSMQGKEEAAGSAPAMSSANAISKAAAGGGDADVLADLSKLQREVDALRGRYGGI